MRQSTFRIAFVLGPFLMCSIVPSILFGFLLNQWGTNLIWGSVFGIGFCVTLASESLSRPGFVAILGLLWAWSVPVALFVASGWLWKTLSERGRIIALGVLALTFLPIVPADIILNWEARHFHLPDFNLYLNGFD
jgi:hypothetical protein